MVELAWPIIKLTCRDRKNVDDQHWGTLSSGAGGGDGMGGVSLLLLSVMRRLEGYTGGGGQNDSIRATRIGTLWNGQRRERVQMFQSVSTLIKETSENLRKAKHHQQNGEHYEDRMLISSLPEGNKNQIHCWTVH